MIRRLLLKNFKVHATLDLSDIPQLALLAGPNNVGKSAILQALAIPRYGLADEDGLNIGPWTVVPKVGSDTASVAVTFAEEPSVLEYSVGRNQRPPEYIDLSDGTRIQSWALFQDSHVQYQGLWMRTFPNPLGHVPHRWSDRAPVRYVSALRGLPESFSHQPLGGDVGPRGQSTGAIIHELIVSRDKRFDLIEKWAQNFGLDLNLISSRSIAPTQGLTGFTIRGVATDSKYVGSGTLAVLPILVQGVLCGKGETLLVEEPESHLHRGAMNGLWRFFEDCRSRGVQVIATTHSFDFLEALYRRARAGQVNGQETALFDLSFGADGGTVYERIPPEKIQDYRDRIIRQFAD